MTAPRGIRNNNPGNIELGDPWQGLAPQQTDGRFAQFTSPEYGIRAMAKVLGNYQTRHGLTTPREMIGRWAPAGENDVNAYVSSVARRSGLNPDAPVNLAQDGDRLIDAMIQHENGQQPFSREMVLRGIEMAGLRGGSGQTTMQGGEGLDGITLEMIDAEIARRQQVQQQPQITLEMIDAEIARRQAAQPEQEAAEGPSMGRSAALGAAQGLTLGFADELAGMGRAVAKSFAGAFTPGVDDDVSDVRIDREATERARAAFNEAEEANPGSFLAGEIAGAVGSSMLPAGAAIKAGALTAAPKSLIGRTAAGMGGGAAIGAADGAVRGAGEAEEGSRLEGAKEGAAVGGLVGAGAGLVAPLVGEGVRNVVRRIRSRPDREVAAAVNASPESVEIVGRMLGNDGADAIGRIRAGGDQAMLADAGPASAGLLDASIQRAGPGGAIAREAITQRSTAAGREIDSALDQFLAPSGGTSGVKSAARDIAQRTAGIRARAYEKAFAAPIDYASEQGRVLEEVFAKIPARTLRSAIQDANEEMVSLGLRNQQILAEIAEDGSVSLREMPNVRQLDAIKQALDRAGSVEDVFGRPTKEALRPRRLARELRAAIGKAVPEYDRAVKLGGQKIAEDNALQTGRRILQPGFTREDVADALETASSAELKAAKIGLRRQIDEVIKNVKRSIGDANMDAREGIKAMKELSSGAVREKVSLVLGQKAAKTLFDRIDRASKGFELAAATADNSRTFARLSMDDAIKEVTEPGAIMSLLEGSPVQSSRRILQVVTNATPQARRDIEERIAGEIASLLTSSRGAEAAAQAEKIIALLASRPKTEAIAERAGQIATAATGVVTYQPAARSLATQPQ